MRNNECKGISLFYGYIILAYTIAEGLFGYGFTAFMYSKGLNLVQIGVLMGVTDLFTTIFDYPSGNLCDKYGRKKICGLGFVLYGFGFIIFGLSSTFLIFLFSGLIRAIGVALISGAPATWYLAELEKRNAYDYKNKILPLLRGITLLVGSLSGIIAGKLSNINYSIPLYVGGVILIFSGIIINILYDDNKGNIQENNMFRVIINNTISFIKDPNMRLLSGFEMTRSIMFTIFIVAWQVYAITQIGLKMEHLGYIYSFILVLMSITSFASRFLQKKMQGVKVTEIGVLFSIIGISIFLINKTVIIFLIGLILFEIGTGLLNASYYTWVYDFMPSNTRSSYASALSSIQSFIGFILSICIGNFLEFVGYQWGWIVAIFFQAIALIFLIKIRGRNALINEKQLL